MSVLIKGMEMPKKGEYHMTLYVDSDSAYIDVESFPEDKDKFEVIQVPPHGRLIDADALEEEAQKRILICDKNDNQFQKPYEIMRAIALAPTVIEAESYSERELQRDYEASVEYAQHCGRYEPTYDPDTGAM